MKIVIFDPVGGPIRIAVSCRPNRTGSYSLFLWESNKNVVVKEYAGNFINTDDDAYNLDQPNTAHDGRLIEAMVVIAIPSGVGPSDVTLSVSQNGAVLGTESARVAPGTPGAMVDLFIALKKR